MKWIFALLFSLSVFQSSFSQDNDQDGKLVSQAVYEKIYLHIDREVYAPGEDIWFKIYLVSGINHRLLDGYKNAYVQLVNDSGLVVFSRLILVYNGVANGDFRLPGRMAEGPYTVRAYTKYLKGFGEESLFHKRIWITNKRPAERVNDTITDSLAIDAGFYPEGGNLVVNASNNIAFKVMNSKGRGIDVSGLIVNDLGDTITPFRTRFMGMGKFSLMPEPGRKYFAIINGYPSYTNEFQDILSDGLVLTCKTEPAKVIIGVSRNYSQYRNEKVQLVASHKGTMLFEESFQMNSFSTEIEISKERFPMGISIITLKDASGLIQSERLVFIDVERPPLLTIQLSEQEYQSRSKVNLSMRAVLEPGDSLTGGVSVAVVNADYLEGEGYQGNIRSHLLLDSELKGPIESSAAYFVDDDQITSSEKLDLLMMVQGWRSYYWPEVISREPEDLAGWEDVGLQLEGRVKRLFRDKPIEDSQVILGPFSKGMIFKETTTNEDGQFRFDRLFLLDSSQVILQAKTPAGADRTEILVDKIYQPELFTNPSELESVVANTGIPASYFSENFSRMEAERRYAIESGTYWLEEVEVVTSEREAVLDLTEEAQRTYGTPQRRFEITEDDQAYMNIYDYLEGKVPGVMVDGNTISIRGGLPPTILLDGVVNDLVDIGTIPMGDISRIDLFYSGAQMAAFGSRGGDGIIAIYTKMGKIDTDFTRYVRGRTTMIIDGFQVPRKFYTPAYSWEDLDGSAPDYRPTLHWEPYAQFTDGACDLEFFTSDFRNNYLVIVEGISKMGEIINGIGSFRVK